MVSVVVSLSAKEPVISGIQPVSSRVGLYEKFELRIDLEATYANPYDPEEIDLRAEFTFEPAEVTAGGCDAWAMRSDKLIFGWVVNPQTNVTNESFTIAGLRNGDYEVRLYRTWRDRYLDPQTLPCRDGKLTVTIPELRTTQGHASHIGNDVAFQIVPK